MVRLRLSALFDQDPAALRRLVLTLYALVGPVFCASLAAAATDEARGPALATVASLIAAGAASMVAIRTPPRPRHWVFPVAVAPTLCCGIAFVSAESHAPVYLAVAGAPLAWAAALFEPAVAWAALGTAVATCFTAVAIRHGLGAALGNTAVFGTVFGLVAWVIYSKTVATRRHHDRALDLARLEGLATRANEAEFVMRPDGRIVYANDRAQGLYGYGPEELRSLNVRDLRAPSSAALVTEQMEAALRTGIRFESEHRRKDGTPFPVEVSSRAFTVAGQTYLHSIVRDLSEARRADAQQRLLAALVTHMRDAVIVTDPEFRVTEFLGAAERLYGWTREEALGRSVRTDLVRRHPNGDAETFRARLDRGEHARAQVQALRKDGTWVDLDLKAGPLHGDDGQVTGYFSVARDMREQVAAARALEESRRRLAHVLEGSNDGLWDWHVPSGHVTFSERWASMLGYGLDELEEHLSASERLVHPDDRAEVTARVGALLRGETALYESEHRMRRKDGTWAWILDRGKVVERAPDGTALRAAGTHTDVSVRRAAEEALRESLARNTALVGELTAALSALRQTKCELRALVSRADAAREEDKVQLSRDLHDDMAQLLSALLVDLRAIERWMEARGAPELEEHVVSALDLTSQAIGTVRRIATDLRPVVLDHLGLAEVLQEEVGRFTSRHGIPCELALAPELPAVRGEAATAVYRIAQEALTNVARHARASRVRVTLRAEGGAVALEIEDDGRGLAGGGPGLGLVGMRERAERLGGAFEIASDAGRTTVRARIPLAAA